MKSVFHGNTMIGKELKTSNFHVFFGNKSASAEILKFIYPKYTFHFLKQVHSDRVVRAPSPESADGHWTNEKEQALGIYTADCLPVFCYDNGRAVAFHAGWRGVVAEIVSKGLRLISPVGSEAFAFVGPHLQAQSFEVHLDVAEKLEEAGGELISHRDKKKAYIDLSLIVFQQLKKSGFSEKNIWIDKDNTFENPNYYSYRTTGKGTGRLISFIVGL
jgi:polyphenol oxidase